MLDAVKVRRIEVKLVERLPQGRWIEHLVQREGRTAAEIQPGWRLSGIESWHLKWSQGRRSE